MAAGGNGRFQGNEPGNRNQEGKGDLNTTIYGDHILGTDEADTGADVDDEDSITAEDAGIDYETAGLAAEDELINLQDGDDLFNGFGGDDWVYGGAGDDNLNGGDGDDVLAGGADDDTIEGGAGADFIDGGDGNDTASYEDSPAEDETTGEGVNVNLATGEGSGADAEGDVLVNIENLIGSDYDDTLTGDDNDNVIYGGEGADIINAGDGADVVVAGDGGDNDTINLGGGDGFSSNPADSRDDFRDIVVAAGSHDDNGTDTVLNYGDGNPESVVSDAFDFSEFVEFTDPGVDDEVELNAILHFNEATGELSDLGADGAVGGTDENADSVWFAINEFDDTTEELPETVRVIVDDQEFAWNSTDNDWDSVVA